MGRIGTRYSSILSPEMLPIRVHMRKSFTLNSLDTWMAKTLRANPCLTRKMHMNISRFYSRKSQIHTVVRRDMIKINSMMIQKHKKPVPNCSRSPKIHRPYFIRMLNRTYSQPIRSSSKKRPISGGRKTAKTVAA